MSTSSDHGAHILVFPHTGPGHIIPFLDLTHRLLTRGLTITVLVTPTHLPLLQPLLSTHPSSSLQPLVLSLPEPPSSAQPGLISNHIALRQLHDPIVQWFRSHPSPPVAIISDFFLGWTHHLASQLGVPRVVFSPSGAFAMSIANSLWRDLPKKDDPDDLDFPISFPGVPNSPKYPWWQLSHIYRSYKEGDPNLEIFRNDWLVNTESWGAVFNSFGELERVYIDHIRKEVGHDRFWAVGPLLPPHDDVVGPTKRGGTSSVPTDELMTWLDRRTDKSVVYVCFGSRGVLTNRQMEAVAAALEESGVHFIWCVKAPGANKHVASDDGAVPDGFEDRVVGRGFIVRGWAPQVAILRHRAVGAFMTHCGWNSVLEGVAAGAMMLTWPLGADQFANATLLVDQLGVAVRACEGRAEIVPDSAELARLFADSVDGTRPEKVRAMEMRDAALEAIKGGGSSHRNLDELVKRLNELQK